MMNRAPHRDVFVDPLGGMLGYELRRASVATMNALATALQPHGIRPSEASLLLLVGQNPGCTQSEISKALGAQPANLVAVIGRLTELGAIERGQTEGRAIALHLTTTGQALLSDVRRVYQELETRFTRHIQPELRAQLAETLRLICRNACCSDDL